MLKEINIKVSGQETCLMEMGLCKSCILKEFIKAHGKTVNFKVMDRLLIKMEHNMKETFVRAKKQGRVF